MYLPDKIGIVRDNAIDAQGDQLTHVRHVVHRPGNYLYATVVAFFDQSFIDKNILLTVNIWR